MEDINLVRSNLLGVGGDKDDKSIKEIEYQQSSNSLRLAKFLCGAGQALLAVMEEDMARRDGEMVEGLPQRDIDFADSITVLRIDEVNQNEYIFISSDSDILFRLSVCLVSQSHWLSFLLTIL